MSTVLSTTVPADTDAERRDALADRLFKALIESMELAGTYLGLRLGLYEALRGQPATAGELAARAGVDGRYAREWLEQQAVAGLLDADGEADGDRRRYALPGGHAQVLLDPDDPSYAGAAALWLGSLARILPRVPAAYRSGEGIPYADYGQDCREAIARFNRPLFANELPGWLAAMPGVRARLEAPSARVLDVACGEGWSSIALARAFPGVTVDGVDSDEASIAQARENAAAAGLAGRAGFRVADAAELAGGGGYDAAFVFEALHDMARPVEALRALRAALAPGGSLVVADEKVAEAFGAPGDEVERLNYGFSVWHCLPASRAEAPSAAAGTCLRPATVRDWAGQAGFASVAVAPVDNDLWRFYLLEG
ncbi:MAG TPA: class I SAM-dependent methyltransferase [Actinomycetes bacterium]|nr:class I SAM-dependent methyltransferase [Actinomycetes bacterium]